MNKRNELEEEITKAYKQGIEDERIRWKVRIRKILNTYEQDNRIHKEQIEKLYEEE